MEDKKNRNDEARVLGLKDLESVVGGRRTFRESEHSDWLRVYEALVDKATSLKHQGRNREASKLEGAYADAYDQWIDEIKLAPEDGPDILFSDFFEV